MIQPGIVFLVAFVHSALTSECLVSEWESWSECFGDCSYAVRVRNRDVLSPPLPERINGQERGSPLIRLCPILYETRYCMPRHCTEQEPSETSSATPEPSPSTTTFHSQLFGRTGASIADSSLAMLEKRINDGDLDPSEAQNLLVRNERKQGMKNEESESSGPAAVGNELLNSQMMKDAKEANNNNVMSKHTFDNVSQVTSSDEPTATLESVITKNTTADDEDQSLNNSFPSLPQYPDKPTKKSESQKQNKTEEIGVLNSLTIDLPAPPMFTTEENESTSQTLPEEHFGATILEHVAPAEENRNESETSLERQAQPSIKNEWSISKETQMEGNTQRKTLQENKSLVEMLIDEVMARNQEKSTEEPTSGELNRIGDNIESAVSAESETLTQAQESQEVSDATTTSSSETQPTMSANTTIDAGEQESTTSDSLKTETLSSSESTSTINEESFEELNVTSVEHGPVVINERQNSTNESSVLSFNSTSAPSSTSSETIETTTKVQTWSRSGNYVPNTRKHASEITDQLYLTHEIIQQMKDEPANMSTTPNPECAESNRCCEVQRDACPNGEEPYYVKRYYRPPGSPVCIPYSYPRCDISLEMAEQPIKFEQNCQDLCFNAEEKRIAPLYSLNADH